MMPGGSEDAYPFIEPIVKKVAAQVDDGPCVTYIGKGGAGNYVKMVHNGIEYGDMQLIAEAYDVLKNVGGLTNAEIAAVFTEWNKGELESFLTQITSIIFTVKDDQGPGELVDAILDKTGSKGTGKWTVQEAAEMATPNSAIAAALDARCVGLLVAQNFGIVYLIVCSLPGASVQYVAACGVEGGCLCAQGLRGLKSGVFCSYMSALKSQRVEAEKFYAGLGLGGIVTGTVDKAQLISDVKDALYSAKICSYAQVQPCYMPCCPHTICLNTAHNRHDAFQNIMCTATHVLCARSLIGCICCCWGMEHVAEATQRMLYRA